MQNPPPPRVLPSHHTRMKFEVLTVLVWICPLWTIP